MSDEPILGERPTGAFGRRIGRKAAALSAALRRPVELPAGPPLALVVLGTAALLFLAWLAFDEGSVGWARGLPPWLRDAAAFMSDVGQSQWYLVPSGLLVILLALGDFTKIPASITRGWATVGALAGYLFLSVGLAAILTNILKIVFGRMRPHLFDDAGPRAFDFWSVGYDFASFPSGHATTAGALIVAGCFLLPRLRVLVVLFGLAIATSRVVVGAHYPSDIVAGLAVGTAVAYLLARFFARHGLGFGARPIRPAAAPRIAAREEGLAAFLAAPFRALIG